MGSRLARAYLLAGAVAVGCYLALPPFAGSPWLIELVNLSTLVAVVAGVIRYQPGAVMPWAMFGAAYLLFLIGGYFFFTRDLPFPSFADVIFIGYYPFQAAGLLMLVRRRAPGRDRASLVDALLVTVGLVTVSWTYLLDPFADAHGVDPSSLMAMAYPAMDVLLLAVAARLVMGNGSRSRSFQLISASIVCLILTDVAYSTIEVSGGYQIDTALDVGWMCSYLLWGAAALHPSMRELSERQPVQPAPLSGKRMSLLAAAALVAPSTILVNRWFPIDGFDVMVAAAASAVLFVLVMVRMLMLVSSLREAIDRHERGERREKALRHAATALTGAADREDIRRAAFRAACELVEDLDDVEIVVDLGADDDLDDLAAPGTMVLPLATQAATYGRLVVTTRGPVPAEPSDGLRTLAAQVALALEGATLSDGLTRQRSDARVGALVQNSSDMILVIDADLTIRYATPSVARSLGHLPEALVGTPLPTLVDPQESGAVARFYSWLATRPGESVRAEWRMRHGGGHFTDVEAVSTNLLDNSSVQGIVVTAHDITERKALAQGLQHHVAELEELDRLRGDFVATVSHELRTPLTCIIGEVELLRDGERGELTACQSRGLEGIERNSERLLVLIDDLLTLNHIETSTLELHREPTSVPGLIEELRARIATTAETRSVALTTTCRSATAVVDRHQLDRALQNLLMNAVKFTPEGGTVALAVYDEGDDVVFVVSDTGVGIPVEEQDRLFTRFFRSSIATQLAIQGTGLGLVIVKRIVEGHGGTIAVESTPGLGTTVTVRIPGAGAPGVRADAA